MGHLYELVVHDRRRAVHPERNPPEEWKYKPGIYPVDPDDHNAPLIAGALTAVLFEFMKTIEADAKRLKEAGRDY